MTNLSLRDAAMAVSAQIEQFYDVRVTFVWNNTDANALGFRLPGPHTVGFVCRTFYGDGSEFLTVIPLTKAVIKDPANWPAAMDAFGRAWITALENEAERLRPETEKPPVPDAPVGGIPFIMPEQATMYECPSCGGRVLRELVQLLHVNQCPSCGAVLTPPAPPRQQKPGNGRNQPPRRNEEKRPL